MSKVNLEKMFVELIQQHERIIYKVCSVYASPELPIADLYQEAVSNLWAGFPKFRNECAASTWIYRVTLNTCVSGIRKDNRRPKTAEIAANLAESLAAPESMSENIREMYRMINHLQTIEKAIVLLYLEEKSYQEIADITGLTLSNVATKLKRAREKLKQLGKALS